MKRSILAFGAAVLLASPAPASLFSTNWSTPFVNGAMVPDENLSGWTDTRALAGLSGTIQDITVTLDLAGGWNGDLYAYLTHDTGFSVLLDRVGYADSGFGYGDSGFDVRLNLTGSPIESYQSGVYSLNGEGQLTGDWAAHSGLVSFLGLDPNGSWSLFIADHSAVGVTAVQNWGLELELAAVPEAETWVAGALAVMFSAFWVKRQLAGSRGGGASGS